MSTHSGEDQYASSGVRPPARSVVAVHCNQHPARLDPPPPPAAILLAMYLALLHGTGHAGVKGGRRRLLPALTGETLRRSKLTLRR